MDRKKKNTLRERMEGAVFIGPAVLVFVPVVAIPFLYSIVISLTKWDGISSEITWVGLTNYLKILTSDSDFNNSLWFTLRISFVTSTVSNILGIFFAV